jgi:hypothetical protein
MISYIWKVIKTNIMKKIKEFFHSGFGVTGHGISTHLYYYEGKPEIGYLLVENYKIFWLDANTVIAAFPSLEETRQCAQKLGIKL